MRVCPKCGFVDPPAWRNSRYDAWADLTHIEDFKTMHPILGKILETKKKTEDENYVYYRPKMGMVVLRKWKVLLAHRKKFHSVYVEHHRDRDKAQTKLNVG